MTGTRPSTEQMLEVLREVQELKDKLRQKYGEFDIIEGEIQTLRSPKACWRSPAWALSWLWELVDTLTRRVDEARLAIGELKKRLGRALRRAD